MFLSFLDVFGSLYNFFFFVVSIKLCFYDYIREKLFCMILVPRLSSRPCMKYHGSSQLPLFVFFTRLVLYIFLLTLCPHSLSLFYHSSSLSGWFASSSSSLAFIISFGCLILQALCSHYVSWEKELYFARIVPLRFKCYSHFVLVFLTFVGRTIYLPLQDVSLSSTHLHIT